MKSWILIGQQKEVRHELLQRLIGLTWLEQARLETRKIQAFSMLRLNMKKAWAVWPKLAGHCRPTAPVFPTKVNFKAPFDFLWRRGVFLTVFCITLDCQSHFPCWGSTWKKPELSGLSWLVTADQRLPFSRPKSISKLLLIFYDEEEYF